MKKLSHADARGKARMVNVGGKPPQRRQARATGVIRLAPLTRKLIRNNQARKGDVLAVAQVAGIQAAKRTAELIPLCHPLTLDHVSVKLKIVAGGVRAEASVSCVGRTGAEMEALTAVAVALLTVYDMCKGVDKNMRIGEIRLLEKVKGDVEVF
jgi:cyclic pyranopterin phosphate synthase